MRNRKSDSRTGTLEWSVKSVNCITGCAHDCRYCYARYMRADRFHRLRAEDWKNEQVRPADVRKQHRDYGGTVMFPTSHDITPENLPYCLEVLSRLLDGGNDVLVVSKPHLPCIREICERFAAHRNKIVFRFTIGAMDDDVLGYWDRHAPLFAERLACLKHAHAAGFRTSVSMEPLLDPPSAAAIVKTLRPYVTDSIWIGMLKGIDSRVHSDTKKDAAMIRWLDEHQTDESVMAVVSSLNGDPLIRWKDSYRRVIARHDRNQIRRNARSAKQ